MIAPDDPRHGTTRGHAAGCREACCRIPRNLYEARRRKYRQALGIHRRVPAIGTQRRIRALMRLGWTGRHIADHCGWKSAEAVTEILKDRRWVFLTTAAKVSRAYDDMSMRIGPSEKNRRYAERMGWLPPLAWDDIDNDPEPPAALHDEPAVDPVVVMRLLEGQRVKATKAEKEAAMTQWVADGGSRNELARMHGWKPERYTRHLRAVGEAS